ncbi:MAG: hypothetical protein H3C45_02490 [Bacteroidia bacterium]|nr:hypothetical protein [Bacteroidia bacterium]
MNIKHIAIFSALWFITCTAFAQDTLRTNEYDVIKDFKPTLSEILKITSNPNPEVPEVKAPKLDYTLPETRLTTDATVYTIKPLAMGTALLPKLKSNYFKLGYGNYNSPVIEAYINTVRNKTSQAGVFAKHLSASPSDNVQAFSDNQINMWGKRFLNSGMLHSSVSYTRNVIHLYGFQPQSLNLSESTLRKQYAAIDLNAGYSNIIKDTSKIKYNIDLYYYNFIDNKDMKENDFKLTGTVSKYIGGNPLKVDLGVNTNTISTKTFEYNQVLVTINPDYTLSINNRAFVMLGFNSTIFSDSANGKLYFYPEAEIAYQITPKTITAFAGITGRLIKDTYKSLVNENPFISILNINKTDNKFEFYTGVKGEIGPQTSFSLQYSLATVKNMVFFGYDSVSLGQEAIYDTTNSGLSNVKAELNHEFADKFHFNFVLNYFSYSLAIPAPYGRPTFTTRTAFFYNLGEKIIIRADAYTMNKRTGIEVPSNKEFNLKAITDLNLGVSYKYRKNIGLFLNLNNLTNNKYQRWMNYPVYGFNLLGGITLTF